jgi:phage terminase large subunit-like protein
VSTGDDACETGIVVVGLGEDGLAYVLEDASGQYTPNEWAELVAELFDRWEADRVVAEANNGGNLVESNLRAAKKSLPVRLVHASRGKRARAEPVSSLYEQKRVRHLGAFAKLEDQMTTWDANSGALSPDRVDALVWGLTDLMIEHAPPSSSRGHRGQSARATSTSRR